MSDALTRICARRREDVAAAKARRPLSTIEAEARTRPAPLGFAAALDRAAADGLALIAEIKRSSPSGGEIRPGLDPAEAAVAYRAGGAACLSVLTEPHHFGGAAEDLEAARNASGLPALRKDFMVDPYQVAEARAMGADCILLILAALDQALAAELEAAAKGFGMDVLIEVHDEAELERALALTSALIGINNRDLKTLRTDLATAERLAPRVPSGRVVVAESGLSRPDDLDRLARAGVRRFLVGEALLRQPDLEQATRGLLTPSQHGA